MNCILIRMTSTLFRRWVWVPWTGVDIYKDLSGVLKCIHQTNLERKLSSTSVSMTTLNGGGEWVKKNYPLLW